MTLQLMKVRKFKSVKKNVHATFAIITNMPHNTISHIFIAYYTIPHTYYTHTIHILYAYYTHTIHMIYK